MNKQKKMLWLMVILSSSTLPLLGWKSIRRFIPAITFINLYLCMESHFAYKKKWWVIKEKILPSLIGEFALMVGPFFAGTLWILKWTYGKFPLYMLVNLAFGWFFAFPFYAFFEKHGIWTLKKLSRWQLWLVFTNKAILMYFYQKLVENETYKGIKEAKEEEQYS
ncbi:hypothetical protein [Bacillus alkalisoli]|uniref:hypothetical protein n=1 Tax=Bacillus alkalisoli TaxID=2011008 RepID=UPI000C24EF18|nr:hypothetical protein [Bacillus alkalisoli]